MAADVRSDLENFFGRLHPLPQDKEKECAPDSVLCEAANGRVDERWRRHIEECKNCAAVVRLLREAAEAPGERLQQFLALTKAKAEGTIADRETGVLEAAWAWISLSRARQMFVYGAVAALLLVAVSVSYRQYYGNGQPDRFQLTLGEDENQKAFETSVKLLRTTVGKLDSGKVSPQDIRSEVDEINRALRRVNTEALNGSDRATVISLVRLCKSSLQQKSQAIGNVQVVENRDTEKVDHVLKSFAEYSGQTPGTSPEFDSVEVVSFQPNNIVLSFPASSADVLSDPYRVKAWQQASDAQRVTINLFAGETRATFTPTSGLRKP